MKQKTIIGLSLLLLLTVLFFMAKDLFFEKKDRKNPYEYNLENLQKVDSALICYSEIKQIEPDVEKLYGIAVDSEDRIYIAGEGKVLIYDKNWNFKSEFFTNNSARCITINSSGSLFMGMHDHIEIWDLSGKLIASWEPINEKVIITSIAVEDSSVFVADAGNKIVYHYDLNGQLINNIGKKDTLNDIPGFIIPSPYFDLAIGRDGELWVVNSGRHSFEAYDKNGRLISSWKRTSMHLDGFCGCCNPTHFAFLSDGSFVTSEKGLERIKIHLPSGDFKCVVANPGQFEEGTKGLDLAVDSKDRILVLDPQKGKIRIFEKNENVK